MNRFRQTPQYSKHDFERVNRKRPCQICGKPNWCSYTKDGERAYCMREAAGSVWQARNGANVHLLNSTFNPQIKRTAVSARPVREGGSVEIARASADQTDVVYRTLLEHPILTESEGERPPLLPTHADDLLNRRGFSDTSIAANLYTSTPDAKTLQTICDDIARRWLVKGVPGFYRADGRWKLKASGDGFFVPYRDVLGRIVGLQIRRFGVEPKYIWLSSVDMPEGVSPGSPLHYSKPDLARWSGFTFLTEGALKADFVSDWFDAGAVGIAGVSTNSEKLVSELRQGLPELKKVALIFDSDWRTNKAVRDAIVRHSKALEAAGLDARVWTWDADFGKGLDDALRQAE